MSSKSVDFDHPNSISIRNRYLTCVMLVAQIHAAGLSCGNITPASFGIDSLEKIRFIGFLGGYSERETSSVPLDIRAFSRVGAASLGAPSTIADVYALAIMGLELFGAQFPPASIDPRRLDECLEKLMSDAPPWVLSVLATIVREPKRQLCRDAGEIISAISASDAEYVKGIKGRQTDGAVNPDEVGTPKSIEEIQELLVTPQELRRRRIAAVSGSRWLRVAACGVLSCAVLLMLAVQFKEVAGIFRVPTGTAVSAGVKGRPLGDISGALANLREISNTAQDNDRSNARRTFSNRADGSAADMSDSSSGFESEIPTKKAIEKDSPLIDQLTSGKATPEEIESTLALYEEVDDVSKARLALAFAKSGGEAERLFRALLNKKLERVALAGGVVPENLSTDALFLGAEARLGREVASVWGFGEKLSNDEVLWLAELYPKRRAPLSAMIARLVVERSLVAWPKSVLFEVIAQTDERSGVPYDALIRASRDSTRPADVGFFNSWNDPLSVKVLYAVLLKEADSEVVRSAIIGLTNKPALPEVLRPVLDLSLSGDGSNAVALAKLIGALGVADGPSEGVLLDELNKLTDESVRQAVMQTLIQRGSPDIVRVVLQGFGSNAHPDTLIQLLDRPEPSIRILVIPFLKGVQIASSKARVRERYDSEHDPDVRRVFEAELFPK